MNPAIKTLRAVTAVFFMNQLKPLMTIVTSVAGILIVVVLILAVIVDAWWLLTFLVLIPLIVGLFIIGIVLWFACQRLLPRKLTKQEHVATSTFVSNVEEIVGHVRGGMPGLLFVVAKDLLSGRGSATLEQVINNSKNLRADFASLQQLFRDA